MSSTVLFLFLIVAILVVLLLVGQQSSVRYPDNFSAVAKEKGMQKRLQEIRVGAFVALDTLSDLVFPGSHHGMLEYKKTKRSV